MVRGAGDDAGSFHGGFQLAMERRYLRVLVGRAAVLCALMSMAGVGGVGRAATLEGRMRELLGSSAVKGAQISMDIVEVASPTAPPGNGGGSGTELFGHNATLPLGPASNCKILTTAAALEKYGPKATFKTFLYRVGEDLGGGGGGDRGVGDPKILEANGEKITAPFERWAQALRNAGVTQYRDLIIDDRVFDAERVNPNWPAHDAGEWFCAPIGGVNFNDNCDAKGVPVKGSGDVRGGSVARCAEGGGNSADGDGAARRGAGAGGCRGAGGERGDAAAGGDRAGEQEFVEHDGGVFVQAAGA